MAVPVSVGGIRFGQVILDQPQYQGPAEPKCFIHNWSNLCLLTMAREDNIEKVDRRGYIVMWAVSSNYRKRSTGPL